MKYRALFSFFLLVGTAFPQAKQEPPLFASTQEEKEQRELSTALGEAGNSPVDFIRALEQHLQKYPDTRDRDKIERALVQSAIETKDDRRIVLYGERVLAKNPKDVLILEKVATALLAHDDQQSTEKGYRYAHTLELEVENMRKQKPPEGYSDIRWQNLGDRNMAGALRLEARAQGNLGNVAEAVALAKRAWETSPSAAIAREWGRWLEASGNTMEAVARYADAFTIEDPDSNEEDRARDRARMGELYHKKHHSEKGLGDIILQAYDRTSALMSARLARLREGEPNLQAKAILDFTLPAVKGEPLKLKSLLGKTVVMDFWATWCGPCRAQHPMYQEVAAKFATNPNVVFVSVNTDEDHSKVASFMTSQQWTNPAYYEAGLAQLLRVNSIPTTIVLDREGKVVSRMAGYIPGRFVDMLAERIQESLKE